MTENKEIIYPNIKQSWGIVGIAILAIFLFIPVKVLLQNATGEGISFFVYSILTLGTTFVFAHLIRKKKTGISQYNFHFSSAKIILLVSFATITIQVGIISPIISIIPMSESVKDMFLKLSNQGGVFLFIAGVILAPIIEELIFRGIILDGLLRRYSPVKSIIVSSILFGIVHLNPWQFISAVFVGFFSGWVYYKTNNLTLSILIHLVNNLFGSILMYFIDVETSMNDSIPELYGGYTSYVLIAIGAIMVSMVCIFLLRIEFKNRIIEKWHI